MRADRRLLLLPGVLLAVTSSCGDLGGIGDDTVGPGGSDSFGGKSGSSTGGSSEQGGAGAGKPSDCQAEDHLAVSWERLSPAVAGVTPRSRATLAETEAAIVLFGGEGAGTALGDTWTFQLEGLKFVPGPAGPSARTGHAMVGAGKMALLFGGVEGLGNSGETWAWADGWTQLCASGGCADEPPARAHHAMAFDPGRGLVVLFGGSDRRALGDTWTWEQTGGWRHICGSNEPGRDTQPPANTSGAASASQAGADTGTGTETEPQAMGGVGAAGGAGGASGFASCGPAPRADHSLVYDSSSHSVVLFGGSDGSTDFEDVWRFDTDGWHQLEVTQAGPGPRSGHSAVIDSATGLMLVLGGVHDGTSAGDDVWGLALDSGKWLRASSSVPAPSARNHAAMVADGASKRALLFAGHAATDLSDLWALSASYASGEQRCACQLACQNVCDGSGVALCSKRCDSGLEHPHIEDCFAMAQGGSGGAGGGAGATGGGGSGDAAGQSAAGQGGADTGPQTASCQSLFDCCATLTGGQRAACLQAALADDPATCDPTLGLCSAQAKNPSSPSDCLLLAACCTNLGGNLRNSCVALLNDTPANCNEFASGGFCRTP